jgi:hypothetical protein
MAAAPTMDQAAEGDDLGDDDVVSDDMADDVTIAAESSGDSTPPPSFEPSSPVPDDTPSLEEEPVRVVSSSLEQVSAPEEGSPVSPVESVESSDLPREQS